MQQDLVWTRKTFWMNLLKLLTLVHALEHYKFNINKYNYNFYIYTRMYM